MVDIKEIEAEVLPQGKTGECFSSLYRKIFARSGGDQFNPEPIAGKAESTERGTVSILVVDDDLIFGRSFVSVLKEKGYNAELANTGKSAIAEVENRYFDVVFLDVKLPDMNGVEVLKRIKTIRPETKVIMITAFSYNEFADELLQLGAFAYFCKPFDISLAFRAIEEIDG